MSVEARLLQLIATTNNVLEQHGWTMNDNSEMVNHKFPHAKIIIGTRKRDSTIYYVVKIAGQPDQTANSPQQALQLIGQTH